MDFAMDALSNGRRLKCLTIVDDFTREAIEIVVDHSMTGAYVTAFLTGWRCSDPGEMRGVSPVNERGV